MQKKILIAQASHAKLIRADLRGKFRGTKIAHTDSFDRAVEIARDGAAYFVISSEMFNDSLADDHGPATVPKSEKNGNSLARLLKEINPDTQLWVYSRHSPSSTEHIDGYIHKNSQKDFYEDLKAVLEKSIGPTADTDKSPIKWWEFWKN